MISSTHLAHWRKYHAPWAQPDLVEHDLVLSRCLVLLFQNEILASRIALRGGTALNKLFYRNHARFSEDIDLVQTTAEANGPLIDAIRNSLDPLFVEAPKRKVGPGITTITYRFNTEGGAQLKLKIETNTREHKAIFPLENHDFVVDSTWFQGSARVKTYALEELLGTKLRALYQRRKGRDLYDFWALGQEFKPNIPRVLEAFHHYLNHQELMVSKAEFELNLTAKVQDAIFRVDMPPLLQTGVDYDVDKAFEWFREKILVHWD
jgi:predicted nucleotidyltransferase component of viral defense system